MKNLRTYYSKELGKVKDSQKSGAGTDDLYKSKWPFFNRLEFLRDQVIPRRTTSNLNNSVRIKFV